MFNYKMQNQKKQNNVWNFGCPDLLAAAGSRWTPGVKHLRCKIIFSTISHYLSLSLSALQLCRCLPKWAL